jgi:hypothetical protein
VGCCHGPSRALLVPEVLQASALDCGPAALASLLEGFGVGLPFDQLRDACRTGRDGTSIDALEAVAVERGLDAEQVLVPVDHLSLPEAGCLPCILVVTQPGGAAHFVALWRIHGRNGRRAQLMDPAAGRRWPAVAALEREAYRHGAVVPAAAWRAWAASEAGLRPLAARLAALGVPAADRQAWLGAAAAGPGWQPLAALDATTRFVRELLAAGGVGRGRDAARLLGALLERVEAPAHGGAPPVIPPACWSVRRAPPDPAGPAEDERLLCTGAVLVRIRGLTPRAEPRGSARGARGRVRRGFSVGPAARPDPAPGEPGRTERHRGRRAPPPLAEGAGDRALLTLASAGGAVGRFAEAVLLVAALELLPAVPSRRFRLGVLAALVGLGGALLLFDLAAAGSAQVLGRRHEIGLRLRLAAKLPRLPDRYLRTRLLADLAERAHLLVHLRRGPDLAAARRRAGLEALLAAGGIAWLDPALAAAALAAGAAAPALAELRRGTAWAAPEVAIWRSSLLSNLCEGMGTGGPGDGGSGAAGNPAAAPPPAEQLAPVEALRSSLLLELVSQLPLGLETPLGEGGSRLSGGEAQRLRFARALRRTGVRLALLDEPFRGLGADQRRHLLGVARARWRDATLLCVTHSPAEALGFDRLLVLADGGLVEDGAPAALAARRGSRYRALLAAEARAAGAAGGPGWRRLAIADGRLREIPDGAAAPAGTAPAAPARADAALPGSSRAPRRPGR